MKVDSLTGAIALPSGYELNRDSQMEVFRASGLCAPEDIYNPGTPWYYHKFRDGNFEGHALSFSVCFYRSPRSPKSVLTNCSFGAPPWDQGDAPAEWSLDVDAQQLKLNLRLVEKLLGKPHEIRKNYSDWKEFSVLQNCAIYNFGWGAVWCGGEDIKTNLVDLLHKSKFTRKSRISVIQRRHDEESDV